MIRYYDIEKGYFVEYTEVLRDHNLKATPQRVEIVKELYGRGHLGIDELYMLLKKSFPSISLATIYKNINAMLEIGFISEVKIANKKSVYELKKIEHSHVVCVECSEVLDLDLDINALMGAAKKRSGYRFSGYDIVLRGVCKRCSSYQ